MDIANRTIITFAAMLVAFIALLLVLLAWGATSGTIGQVEDFAGYLRDHDGSDAKLIVTLVALVVVLLMLAVIIVELTPSPTQRMRVRDVASGDATLTTKEIAERVEQEVRLVPHVRDCAAIVAARGKRVEVVLDLHVEGAADLAEAADEACRRTQTLIEQRIGIDLALPPRARLHYRELRLTKDAKGNIVAPAPEPTGWERPNMGGGTHDERTSADASEEAHQA